MCENEGILRAYQIAQNGFLESDAIIVFIGGMKNPSHETSQQATEFLVICRQYLFTRLVTNEKRPW